MNSSHRACEQCDLRVQEKTLQQLAESVGKESQYRKDIEASCPECGGRLIKQDGEVPDSAREFDPISRTGIGEDTIREVCEDIFAQRGLI